MGVWRSTNLQRRSSPEKMLASGDLSQATSPVHDALFSEVIERFGSATMVAWGSSMLPAIWPGDELLVSKADPSTIMPGMVVVIIRQGKTVAHRVVRTWSEGQEWRCQTQGDSLPHPEEPCGSGEIVGVASTRTRYGSTRAIRENGGFAKAVGRLCAYSTPFAKVVVFAERLAHATHWQIWD